MTIHRQPCQSEFTRSHRSHFIGSCVIAGILLSIILAAVVDFLRPDYNLSRNLLDESLVGPLSLFGKAAAWVLAATLLLVLIGLRLDISRSGFRMVSCVLIGVVAISLGVSALFPLDEWSPNGSHSTSTAIIHLVSGARFYALLIALLVTLPIVFKRDEKWRPLSHVTLLLGLLTLAFQVVFVLTPSSLSGLVDRGSGLVILVWLFLVGLRLRQTIISTHGTAP